MKSSTDKEGQKLSAAAEGIGQRGDEGLEDGAARFRCPLGQSWQRANWVELGWCGGGPSSASTAVGIR